MLEFLAFLVSSFVGCASLQPLYCISQNQIQGCSVYRKIKSILSRLEPADASRPLSGSSYQRHSFQRLQALLKYSVEMMAIGKLPFFTLIANL